MSTSSTIFWTTSLLSVWAGKGARGVDTPPTTPPPATGTSVLVADDDPQRR